MCSFITQHNATDVARFEGGWNWYADCRNELNVHFSTINRLQCHFREFCSTSNHFSDGNLNAQGYREAHCRAIHHVTMRLSGQK